MADPQLVIQRRFPTFDFVLHTKVAADEAPSKLELFLRQQERPKGFVFTDPRVDGEVYGSTFTLRRREASLANSVRPYADGYIVPIDGGSRIHVRVQSPWWSWLLGALFLCVTAASLSSFDLEGLLLLAGVGVLSVTVLALPVWFDGSQIAALLRRVFAS